MNAWPSLNEWARFGGVLALELVVVFAVAKLISLRLRSATWRRALWQMTLLALLLVTVGELNGVRGWLRLPEKKAAPLSERKVVVTLQDAEPDWALFREQLSSEAAPLVSATAKPSPPPSRWQQHTGWPAVVWAVVAALILFRLLIAQFMALALRIGSHRSSGQPCPLNVINAEETADMAVRSSDAVATRVQSIAQSLGIRRPVALLTHARPAAPFTFGVWRPVIVLPRHFTSAFTREQQDAALAHELAHVAGLDSAWRAVSQLACAVLWWHPLVWLARRELDHASELVADEASLLVANGPDRLAECLVACAKELRRPALTTWLGMDGGGFRSALGKRVNRLLQLDPRARLSRPVPWYLRLLAPVVCVALLWLGVAAVIKSCEPRGGVWRASILGSAFAAAVESPKAAQVAPAATKTNSTTISNLSDIPLLGRFFTNQESNRIETARLVEEGRRFYETGQLHVARTNLQAALRIQPTNQGALYYLELVNARELATRARLQEIRQKPMLMDTPPNQAPEASATNFQTRFFSVDPKTLEQGLKSISTQGGGGGGRNGERKPLFNPYDTNSVIERVQRLFEAAGVDLSAPGRALIYQERVGTVMVRATPAELDTVGKAVQLLNMTPPQLTIRVKMLEVERKGGDKLAFDWFPGTLVTNQARARMTQSGRVTARNFGDAIPSDLLTPGLRTKEPEPATPTITGILTDQQFRAMVKTLENRGGTDLLSAPEITTMSGRQAQIKVVDIKYIVTDMDYSAFTTNTPGVKKPAGSTGVTVSGADGGLNSLIAPIAQPFEIGPVIDVIPYVEADGYTITMTVLPTMREFLGYDDPGDFSITVSNRVSQQTLTQPVPLPKFRLRQIAATARIWDGQTLMLGAGSARTMQRDRDASGVITTNYTEKELIYFITPRLIDAAGNPLHADDEFPERHKTVPAQRSGGGKP